MGFLKAIYYTAATFAGFFFGVALSMFLDGSIGASIFFGAIVIIGFYAVEKVIRGKIFLNPEVYHQSYRAPVPQQFGGYEDDIPVETVRYNLLREIEVLGSFIEHKEFKSGFQDLQNSVKSLRKSYKGVENQFLNREDADDFVKESITTSFNHVMKSTREFVEKFKFFDPDSNEQLMQAASRRGDEEHRVEYEELGGLWLDALESMLKVVGDADVQMKKIMMSQGNYTVEDSEIYIDALNKSLSSVRQGLW